MKISLKLYILSAILIVSITLIFLKNSILHNDEKSIDDSVISAHSIHSNSSYDKYAALYKLRYDRTPPLKFHQWYDFAVKNQCTLDENVYANIYQDLSPFFGMSSKEFNHRLQLISKVGAIHHIRVENGEASDKGNHLIKNIAHLLPNMSIYLNTLDEPRVLWNINNPKTRHSMTDHLEDTSFSVDFETYNQTLHDICYIPSVLRPWVSMSEYHGVFIRPDTVSYTKDLLPILSFTRYGTCFGDIRIPNGDYYMNFEKDKNEWADKKPLAYWRGSTTGGKLTINTMNQFQRHRMLSLYQNNSMFDIAFTGIAQCNGVDCEKQTKDRYRFDGHKDFNYMMHYKYLIDVV